MRGIEQPRLKMRWAIKHLSLLDEEVSSFLNGHPYRVFTEDDLDAGEYVIHFSVDPLPMYLPLILGDFVSCLRSSLDHLDRRIPFHSTEAQIQVAYPTSVTPISRGTNNSGIVRFLLSDKPYVQFEPTINIKIQFGDESEGIIVPAAELPGIYKFVCDDVFPRFESFF